MAVYACGDLHGHIKIFKKIKAMLQPKDKVYFIGDAGDRGPKSWECIKAIYEDPQFIYLKGNHEDMLVKACEDYISQEYWDYYSANLCIRNGGQNTIDSWEKDLKKEMWVSRLRNLPLWDFYENPSGHKIILSHAGFTPWKNINTNACIIPSAKTLLWDRKHFYDNWQEKRMDDVVIVHGHTPIQHLSEDLNRVWKSGAFWYSNGHKVCIDSGGFFSGEWILLNLDTLEDTVIKY